MCTLAVQIVSILLYMAGWVAAFYILLRNRVIKSKKFIIVGAVALTFALTALALVFVFACDVPYVKWGSALAGVLCCLLTYEIVSYFTSE